MKCDGVALKNKVVGVLFGLCVWWFNLKAHGGDAQTPFGIQFIHSLFSAP
jgi:hypothetical protein